MESNQEILDITAAKTIQETKTVIRHALITMQALKMQTLSTAGKNQAVLLQEAVAEQVDNNQVVVAVLDL